MGDMGEVFRDLREATKRKKQNSLEQNTQTIKESGLEYRILNNGYHIKVRIKGQPIVDFWPSTNRWSCCSQLFYGTAEGLIEWMHKVKHREGP